MVSDTNVTISIIAIVVLVSLLLAPPFIASGMDALREIFSGFRDMFFEDWGGLGGDNQTQLAWFVRLPDGTEQEIDPTLSVLYGDTEIGLIGFRVQVKLSYSGEISSMKYTVQMSMSFDGETKETQSTGQLISKRIGANGEWFALVNYADDEPAGLTVDARTIESWGDEGDHTLGANVDVSLTVVRVDKPTETLTGIASGTATIRIERDLEMETRVNTVIFSAYPTVLS